MRQEISLLRSMLSLSVVVSSVSGVMVSAVLGTSAAAAGAATPPCGTSVAGTVVFSSDSTCAGDGLYVESGVSATIDLDGYVLAGNLLDFTGGVNVSAGARVTIRNGTIRDFGRGVVATSAVVVLDGVQLVGNASDGLRASGCAGCRVVDSVVTGNGEKGLVFEAPSDRVLIQGTLFSHNDDDAIYLAGSGAKIVSNTVVNNGERGIRMAGTGNAVSGNVVGGNAFSGIVVEAGSLDTAVTRNMVTGGTIGIHVQGASGTTVQQNTVVQTSDAGIRLESAPLSTLARNTVSGGAASGIYVDAFSPDGAITSNVASGNSGSGFFSVHATTTFTANRALGNALEGFDLEGMGAIDGGKNVAAGNLGGGCEAPLVCP